MKIDEKALEAAYQGYAVAWDGYVVPEQERWIRASIEAYEAARSDSHYHAGISAMATVIDPLAFMSGIHPEATAARQARGRLLASKALKAYQDAEDVSPAAEEAI